MQQVWWLAIMIMSAGCATNGADSDAIVRTDPCIVQAAGDYSCEAQDTNKTPDQVAHLHDYWGGRETARILEQTQGTGGPSYGSCDAYPVLRFYPDEGKTVYQGTGIMDIEVMFTPDADHVAGAAELWIKRADQDRAEYVADVAEGTLSIDVPYNASDLPHQVLSAWEFWIYFTPDPTVQSASCQIRPRGDVELAVDVEKTHEIQPFPGHPDHWGDGDERLLLQEFAYFDFTTEHSSTCLSGNGTSHPTSPCQAYWDGLAPRDGRIVPPETELLRITLTADPSSTDAGTELGLQFHGGDTRSFETVEPIERDGDVALFEIPAQGRTDGPYAEQSQWRFKVIHDDTSGVYQGGWTLDGVALKANAA